MLDKSFYFFIFKTSLMMLYDIMKLNQPAESELQQLRFSCHATRFFHKSNNT